MKAADIARIAIEAGHRVSLEERRPLEGIQRWGCLCSCGYRSTPRTSVQLARSTAGYHLGKVAAEVVEKERVAAAMEKRRRVAAGIPRNVSPAQ